MTTTTHRVTEDCKQRPEVALPKTSVLIEAGPVMPGDSSGYATRILFARCGSDEYVTWHAAYPDDGGPAYCFNGHYFKLNQYGLMNAAADYAERIKRGY